ncbi:MAG: ester cyclase [Rhodobacterales bacterium]|jgi:hypothetical protein|tara:strand:+ start:678 stop:1829 length:1152 start_codon:yes stop_codon:yes gene_type:complete
MSKFTPDRLKSYHPASPLSRGHMPNNFEISLKEYTKNQAHRIPPYLGISQPLMGFDSEYRNIIDYIVRITYRIWETNEREVDYISDCYSDDSLVYDDYGLQVGNKKIIADTHHTTSAFPDIVLNAEEVIWSGDDQVAFHTSHLTRIIATNTAKSRYGDATGHVINVPVIANCVAMKNDIFLEHVLYNTSAMLQQLGIDLWEEVDRLVADPPAGWPRSQQVWDDLRSAVSPTKALSKAEPVDGFDPDAFSREIHDNIWNGDGSKMYKAYAPNVEFEGTTERKFKGTKAYKGYIEGFHQTFSNFVLQVDEVYWMGNETDGYLISTRWSAEGIHSGEFLYRAPTEKKCQIWGLTQWRLKNGLIENETQLFNELDLMMQIGKARLDD